MLVNALLAVAFAAATLPDSTPPITRAALDTTPPIPFAVQMPADTGGHEVYHPHRRVRAVFHSDAYYTRLTIHRDLSYAMYPLYAAQYIAGQELWKKGRDAPTWAKTGHRVFATALVGVFGVNTVTGAVEPLG